MTILRRQKTFSQTNYWAMDADSSAERSPRRFPSFNREQILELFNVLTQDTFQEINFLALENHFNLSTCPTNRNVTERTGKKLIFYDLAMSFKSWRKKKNRKNRIEFEGRWREKKQSKFELQPHCIFFFSFSSLSCVNRILIEHQRSVQCSMNGKVI